MRFASLWMATCLGLAALDAAGQDLARAARDGQIASARVILFESGIQFRMPMNETNLQRWGCTFTVSFKPDKMADLVDLLERNLRVEPGHEGFPDQLRNIVYVRLLDGTRYRYALTDEVGGPGAKGTVYAWVDTYHGDGLPLVAGAQLLRELRTWAASDTGRMNFRPACLENRFGNEKVPGVEEIERG